MSNRFIFQLVVVCVLFAFIEGRHCRRRRNKCCPCCEDQTPAPVTIPSTIQSTSATASEGQNESPSLPPSTSQSVAPSLPPSTSQSVAPSLPPTTSQSILQNTTESCMSLIFFKICVSYIVYQVHLLITVNIYCFQKYSQLVNFQLIN